MIRRRNCRRIIAAVAASVMALAVVGATQGPVGAESPVAVGWWWRAKSGPLGEAMPRPQQVPEGGLYVAGMPDGPTAISALRYELPSDAGIPVLTLDVAEERGGDDAKVAACLATTPWEPADGGDWDAKPEADCETGMVEGEPSEDGAQWTFDLAPLVPASGGPLDIVIAPGANEELPEGVNGSTFELAFDPPGPESMTTASETSDEPRAFGGATQAPAEEERPSTSGEATTAGGPSFEATEPPAVQEPQPEQPSAPPQEQAAPPSATTPAQAAAATSDSARNAWLAGIVGAALAGAVLITAAAQRRTPTVLRRHSRLGAEAG